MEGSKGRSSLHSHVRLCLFDLSAVVVGLLLALCSSRVVQAQGVEFNPVQEAKQGTEQEDSEEQKPSVVFSFGRFEAGLRLLCADIEIDQRRQRIFLLAQARAKDGNECPSCRALWRSLVTACRQGKKEEPKGATKKKKEKKVVQSEGSGDEARAVPESEPSVATPTAIPAARLPSTSTLDNVSRISTAFYEADPKRGGVYEAVNNFITILLAQSDLTPAEKDYYGVLTTYLLAAWEGRDTEQNDPHSGSSGASKANKQSELKQLF